MSATPGVDQSRDPEEFERQADAIRADMDRTLDALERKLSPKQLIDRSLRYVNANGGDLLQKLGAAVNRNPLPLILTSAGLVWLAASSRSQSRVSRFDSSSARRGGDFDSASQSFNTGSSRVKRVAGQLKQRASRTYSTTRDRTYEVGRNLNSIIQEQPLVCGAVALAVGAVVGAALPATEFERDLVARAREKAEPLLDEVASSFEGNNDSLGQSTPTSH